MALIENHLYARNFVFQAGGSAAAPGAEYDGQGLPGQFAIVITFRNGSTGGVITVEESDVSGYAGTWGSLATVTWMADNTKRTVKLGGTFRILRCRISTPITGGVVD